MPAKMPERLLEKKPSKVFEMNPGETCKIHRVSLSVREEDGTVWISKFAEPLSDDEIGSVKQWVVIRRDSTGFHADLTNVNPDFRFKFETLLRGSIFADNLVPIETIQTA